MKNVIIISAVGFIDNHGVHLFVNKYLECDIINLD